MYRLRCVHGMNKDDEFPINDGVTSIGRGRDCQAVIFDKRCSRRHCLLFANADNFFVEDVGSRHGTSLNDKKVKERTRIKVGDQLKVGNTVLIFTDKPMDLLAKEAEEVAHELQTHEYTSLMDRTSVDAMQHQIDRKMALREKRKKWWNRPADGDAE